MSLLFGGFVIWEERFEGFWDWRVEFFDLTRERMFEFQAVRMQPQTFEWILLGVIFVIADDVMAKVMELRPDLVFAPGFDRDV